MEINVQLRDEDSEKIVLGTIITERNALEEVRELLSKDSFYNPFHLQIYEAILQVASSGSRPDVVAVKNKLIANGVKFDLMEYMRIASNCTFDLYQYAARLHDLAIRRKFWDIGQYLVSNSYSEAEDILDVSNSVSNELASLFKSSSTTISTINDGLESVYGMINDNLLGNRQLTGIPTGFEKIDSKSGGLQKSDLIIIAGETSQGKALRMDEKILTPNGWVLNKDIKVGDKVASIDGEKSIVLGVYPQGMKDIYKMTFTDGRVAFSSGDHLWEVGASTFKSGNRILTTLQIKEMQENTSAFHNRMYVPMFCGKFGEKKNFIIHPYILGVLIGDGCLSRGATFCNDDKFVLGKMRSLCKMPIVKQSSDESDKCPTYRISYGHNQKMTNIYYEELRRLGLLNHLAKDKFIPECYLNCCYEQRLELLNGLMDTDGEVDKYGGIHYSTVSERLANDVVYLCRSLGYRCSMFSHKSAIGEKIYESHYRITIAGENEKNICTLPRRKERIKERKRINNVIRSIEYIGKEECQCIKVSHPRELFVISDFVVTHNTSFAVSIMRNAAYYGAKIAMYSMEMKKEQITARILSMESGVPANQIMYSRLTDSQIQAIDVGVGKMSGKGIYFDDRSTSNIDTIISSIRYMKLKFGIDGAIIDYLQILNVNMKGANKEQQMGDVARRLKNLAKELDIWIIALSQLNRDTMNPVPTLGRLRDSGQIAEAADVVILIYRPEVNNKSYPNDFSNVDTKGTAMIDIAKGRNIGLLRFICGFNAATTCFYNLDYVPLLGGKQSGVEDDNPF